MWAIHSPDGAAQYLDIILMDSICYVVLKSAFQHVEVGLGGAGDSNAEGQEHSDTPRSWSMLSVTLSPTFSSKKTNHSPIFTSILLLCVFLALPKFNVPLESRFILTFFYRFPCHICKEFKRHIFSHKYVLHFVWGGNCLEMASWPAALSRSGITPFLSCPRSRNQSNDWQ